MPNADFGWGKREGAAKGEFAYFAKEFADLREFAFFNY
jgi:hypothetical protein